MQPTTIRFNKQSIATLHLPARGTRQTYHDSEVPGLQLRVSSNGSKTFCVFCRRKGGTPERVTIGAYPRISVDRARQLAKRHLADLGEGISVTVRRRDADIAAKTLEAVHKEYLASRGVAIEIVVGPDGKLIERSVVGPASKLKPLTARDYVKAIDKKFADWRQTPISHITRDMIEQRHRKLTLASPAEANRSMRYLRALFAFAADARDSAGNPVVPDNPVRRLSARRLWNRTERRTRYIHPEDLNQWWLAVSGLTNKPQYPSRETLRDYLVLLLLTGLRRNEALCLQWSHVDLKRGTLCAMDTKNRDDHMLPMGTLLWDMLRKRREASRSDWVFENPLTGKRITCPNRQVQNVSKTSGIQFSPHDLRRTFASIVSRLGDRLSYYTTKRLLNHRTSDVTQGYVQFDLEQLRAAMQQVEDFVMAKVAESSSE